MLIWFVISCISSIMWLGYMILYIQGQLQGADFSALSVDKTAAYMGLMIVPLWVIWQIFGMISQFSQNRKANAKLIKLFEHTKKNQDYTDLVVRVMLDAEHEIKDGFIINKFDIFIADINEILADILLRSNAVSSIQMEQLWARVKNGERWVIAKTLIEAQKRQTDFSGYLIDKSQKDSVFKGTLLEFCARYQDLSALLEKHDRDRIFINIIETGVLGKAYSLLAPIVDSNDNQQNLPAQTDDNYEPDFSEAISNIPEPEIEQTPSFWNKINPFHKDKIAASAIDDDTARDNAFFEALQNNLKAENTPQTVESIQPAEINESAPELFIRTEKEPEYTPAPTISATETIEKSKSSKSENDNFAYPFGGWLNENNHH